MQRTLIYYKPGQTELAKKLQDNYIAHQKDTDIISAEEQDDIEYARENHQDTLKQDKLKRNKNPSVVI